MNVLSLKRYSDDVLRYILPLGTLAQVTMPDWKSSLSVVTAILKMKLLPFDQMNIKQTIRKIAPNYSIESETNLIDMNVEQERTLSFSAILSNTHSGGVIANLQKFFPPIDGVSMEIANVIQKDPYDRHLFGIYAGIIENIVTNPTPLTFFWSGMVYPDYVFTEVSVSKDEHQAFLNVNGTLKQVKFLDINNTIVNGVLISEGVEGKDPLEKKFSSFNNTGTANLLDTVMNEFGI